MKIKVFYKDGVTEEFVHARLSVMAENKNVFMITHGVKTAYIPILAVLKIIQEGE